MSALLHQKTSSIKAGCNNHPHARHTKFLFILSAELEAIVHHILYIGTNVLGTYWATLAAFLATFGAATSHHSV